MQIPCRIRAETGYKIGHSCRLLTMYRRRSGAYHRRSATTRGTGSIPVAPTDKTAGQCQLLASPLVRSCDMRAITREKPSRTSLRRGSATLAGGDAVTRPPGIRVRHIHAGRRAQRWRGVWVTHLPDATARHTCTTWRSGWLAPAHRKAKERRRTLPSQRPTPSGPRRRARHSALQEHLGRGARWEALAASRQGWPAGLSGPSHLVAGMLPSAGDLRRFVALRNTGWAGRRQELGNPGVVP
jgi:hypothetical protein